MGLGEGFSPLGKLLSKRNYMTQDEIIEMAKPRAWHGKVEGWTFNSYEELEAFAKLVAEKERTFCIQFLMALHSSQMGAHNYFHYAAQALSQLEGKELPEKFSLTIRKDKQIKKYND
jgi:hypothetical protein